MKKIIFACIGFVLLSSATFFVYKNATDEKFIAFTEDNCYVSGRHEYTPDGPAFSQSGTNITFVTNATQFSLLIQNEPVSIDTTVMNWFTVLVNNNYHSHLFLKPGKNFYSLEIPKGKSATNYITLVKSTESFVGEVKVCGIQLPKGSQCKEADPMFYENILKIQFIGNSITCGYGNMVSIPGPPQGNPNVGFHTNNENAFEAYAMKTARNLKALATLVSYSGIGVCRNFNGDTIETMPKIYNRIHLQNETSALWNHLKQQPDIIVINLGTNDYFAESKGDFLDDSVFVQTYVEFVTRLIKLYPYAKIICANGSMMSNDFPEGRNCWTRIQHNIESVKSHFKGAKGKKIFTFFFTPHSSPFGEDYHPSIATHTKMAEELTTFIQTEVNK